MRILGLLFILGGLFLCSTVLFVFWGVPVIGVGALLCIADRQAQPGPVSKVLQWVIGTAITLSFAWCLLVWYSLGQPAHRSAGSAAGAATSAQQHPAGAKRAVKRAGSRNPSGPAPLTQ